MWGTIPGGDDEIYRRKVKCEHNAFSFVAGTDESEIYDAGKDVLRKIAAILGTSLPEPASRLVESPRETVETVLILIVVTFILMRIRMMRSKNGYIVIS